MVTYMYSLHVRSNFNRIFVSEYPILLLMRTLSLFGYKGSIAFCEGVILFIMEKYKSIVISLRVPFSDFLY